jgi:hypothetical protein
MRDRLPVLAALVAIFGALSWGFPVQAQAAGEPQGPASTPASQGAGGRGDGVQGTVGGVGPPAGGRGAKEPAGPAPRRADGRVLLGGASLRDKGLWLPREGGLAALFPDTKAIPFQPWARALLADRERNQLEPHARCKPSGGSRQFITPYGVEIVDLPELQRVYIFDVGGPHTYRTIHMDGRTHPGAPAPAPYGHSIGWWEGDTLVIDTVGFNEAFWIDRRGMPHTERLHTIERLTRTDQYTIVYELTVDDPGAYTAPWTGGFALAWEAGTELFEYVCQQANYADNLMVGEMSTVDRTSSIVP